MAIDKSVGWLERCVTMVDKYGLIKISKAIGIIILLVFITFTIPYVPQYISKIVEETIKKEKVESDDAHNVLIEDRKSIKPIINNLLEETLHELNADRVFVLEMHNGTNNTAGLPFIYAEMTYEVVSDGVVHIDEDYTNLNLSRFNFPEYLEEQHIWMGTIDSLSVIDKKLSLRMKSNDATYLAVGHIHGLNNELGYMGISWCGKEPPSNELINIKAVEVVQKLSTLLDSKSLYYLKKEKGEE